MKNFLKNATLVFFLCYLSYMAVYIARLNLSMAIAPLADQNILSREQTGLMSTVFFCVFSVGRLINGPLGDRFRPDRFVILGLLIIGVSNLGIALLPPAWCMVLLWGVNAYGQSMLWGALLKIIATQHSAQTAGNKAALLATSTATGSVIGILLALLAIKVGGVTFAFFLPGLLALLAACAIGLFVRTPAPAQSQNAPQKLFFFDKDVGPMLIPAFLHGCIKDNLSLWMAVYFIDQFGIDLTRTTGFVFAIPLTGLVGRLLYMPLYKKLSYRLNRITVLAFLFCAVCALPLCFPGIPAAAAAVCLGLLSAAVMLVNTSIISIFPMRFVQKKQVSGVSGILDFFIYLGAGTGSFIYGMLIDNKNYRTMFISWLIVSLLALIVYAVATRKDKDPHA